MKISVPTVAPTLHTLAPLEGLDVRFAESAQTRFGIDLRGGDALVSEELLDMIERHAGIEEDRGDAGSQAVRRDLLRDPGLRGRLMHDELDVARRVLVAPITLEEVAPPTARLVCLQLLRQGR
jgi:hypothetical protein